MLFKFLTLLDVHCSLVNKRLSYLPPFWEVSSSAVTWYKYDTNRRYSI